MLDSAMSAEKRMRMAGSPLGCSAEVGCGLRWCFHPRWATALLSGVGDVWAPQLAVRKQEQDVPAVPKHQLCPSPGKRVRRWELFMWSLRGRACAGRQTGTTVHRELMKSGTSTGGIWSCAHLCSLYIAV